MKKRFFATFISAIICMLAIGTISVSAYTDTDYLYYRESDGKITISNCEKQAKEIVIPSEIDGKPVTSIGDYAFFGCKSLTSITIPDSVTTIGEYAFRNCESLTSIIIPGSVTLIGDDAFSYCRNLTSVEISNGVTTIGEYAFSNCTALTSVAIPDSVTLIRHYAFSGCSSLNGITIPNSVTSIGISAFSDCSSLTSVTIPYGIPSIENYTFSGCSGLTSVTIPDSVTTIGNYAFRSCESLTSITIPDSVTTIGARTFSYCSGLTSVTIPDSVTAIGVDAFNNCIGLTSITIPDSVTSIGDDAFFGCSSLTSIIVSDKNEYYSSLDDDLYNKEQTLILKCIPSKTEVTIPDGVTAIGNAAFSDCGGLTSITIPGDVSSIGGYAFYNCGRLAAVYYNGTEEHWASINIAQENDSLLEAERIYFAYVTLIDENGKEISKDKYPLNSYLDISGFEEKPGHVLRFYADKEYSNEFDLNTPITKNIVLYMKDVVKTERTETSVSDDKKIFMVTPIGIAIGNTVILALYNENSFVDMKSEKYNGEALTFTTDKAYTKAKIMVWNALDEMTAVCNAETK